MFIICSDSVRIRKTNTLLIDHCSVAQSLFSKWPALFRIVPSRSCRETGMTCIYMCACICTMDICCNHIIDDPYPAKIQSSERKPKTKYKKLRIMLQYYIYKHILHISMHLFSPLRFWLLWCSIFSSRALFLRHLIAGKGLRLEVSTSLSRCPQHAFIKCMCPLKSFWHQSSGTKKNQKWSWNGALVSESRYID